MQKSHNHTLFFITVFAIALLIFGARLWLINVAGVSIPYADEWEIGFYTITAWLNDNLTFSSIFTPYGEHPIALTRLLTLLLIALNGQWDPLLEMVVNAVIYTMTLIFLVIILRRLLGNTLENWIFLSIAIVAIPPYAWINILWGFQSCWYLLMFLSFLSLWGLLLSENFTLKWWIGISAGLLACLNLASGFFALLIVIVLKLYLLTINTEKIKQHLVTLIISILTVSLFIIQLLKAPKNTQLYSQNGHDFFTSLGKLMAWPWIDYPGVSFLIYFPFFALVVTIVWLKRKPSQSQLFIIALGGWVILQAIAMAFARGAGDGVHSISRYWEILSFGIIVNLFSFHFISQHEFGLPRLIKRHINIFACLWGILLLFGFSDLLVKSVPAIQHHHLRNSTHLKNIRTFYLTGETNPLKNQIYPYPTDLIINLLKNVPQFQNRLSYRLATPSLISASNKESHIKEESFVKNGFYPITGKYQGEEVLGSFNHQGNPAVGRFESLPIRITQKWMEIPVAGYLGEKDLSLSLVLENNQNPIILTPPQLAKEQWVSIYVRTPDKPFKLVATDKRTDLWFAFAMPRGVGSLSFYNQILLTQGKNIFLIGIFLITFIIGIKAFASLTKNVEL